MNPLVSIIIPVYNSGALLLETLKSVYKQTYKNYEVIIVNDGSTDSETLDILKDITSEKHESFQVIVQKNMGLAQARNSGINKSKGSLIFPLDADDIISPRFLEKTVSKIMTAVDIGIVSTYVKKFGDHEGVWKTRKVDLKEELCGNNLCGNSLFRKEAYDAVVDKFGYGYDPKMRAGFEDWDFWVSILSLRNWKVEIVPEALFNYRISNKGLNASAQKIKEDLYMQILENHASLLTVEDLIFVIRHHYKRANYLSERVQYLDKDIDFLKNQLNDLQNANVEFIKRSNTNVLKFKDIYQQTLNAKWLTIRLINVLIGKVK